MSTMTSLNGTLTEGVFGPPLYIRPAEDKTLSVGYRWYEVDRKYLCVVNDHHKVEVYSVPDSSAKLECISHIYQENMDLFKAGEIQNCICPDKTKGGYTYVFSKDGHKWSRHVRILETKKGGKVFLFNDSPNIYDSLEAFIKKTESHPCSKCLPLFDTQ